MVAVEALPIEVEITVTPADVDLFRDALVAYIVATTRHRTSGIISESEHYDRTARAQRLAAQLRDLP